ncbi:MAG: hypothetical protein EWV49_01215 [Microcystis aeruginosa Ma_QC_Ch_20071001_S25]|jgi:hypothetical protein|uniref:HAD family hydrolase n=1 Tax=Microcystis aeruginosa Ma_QC_Ch_20071001_S25D TaxID=2486250 RepID=A0A552FZA4_MICAE|nr:MAG: hypothetical protein EWV57_06405 [Microcystis aeruginosa Ma_QC_Ch_20071001_S25D]TRU54597.1 MAG: hypothetical protein EWV49_01215 [Microcystis aeruginosa Ma_QC_Ch_20071001_S25]TRU62062.1 MAG: hypothetical protein EWV90_11415 [Microcystis aeruginosa Ma_QC_Ch_20071001_M135]
MPTIVWDVDDVLNSLMRSWFEECWLTLHPECLLRYEDILENPPHRLLGVSLGEYLASLDSFRLSAGFQQLTPVGEILDWFDEFGGSFRHIALTATPMVAAPISAAWVMRHFGQWIRCFGFVPSKRAGEYNYQYDNNKGEFLAWWNKADILIDDNMVNLEAAKAVGIQTLLMPQPWNNSKLTITDSLELLANLAKGANSRD